MFWFAVIEAVSTLPLLYGLLLSRFLFLRLVRTSSKCAIDPDLQGVSKER